MDPVQTPQNPFHADGPASHMDAEEPKTGAQNANKNALSLLS
jgi:hypothetical protein